MVRSGKPLENNDILNVSRSGSAPSIPIAKASADDGLLVTMRAREAELVAQVDIYEHEITRIREKLPRLRSELASSRASLAQVRKAIGAYTGKPNRRTKSLNPDGTPTPKARGGYARAQSMTPEERTAQARKAGEARWAKAGPGTEGPSR